MSLTPQAEPTKVVYSDLVKAFEEAWNGIQKLLPEVPNAVVVVGSGGARAKNLYGHFAKDTWSNEEDSIHEVLIVAEHLNRGADELFTTLLHEAVHGIALSRGIKETSGKRHNKKFALIAEEIGMQAPAKPERSLGFSAVTLTSLTKELYGPQIKLIEDALKFTRKLKFKTQEPEKTSWSAVCECERKIRVGKKIYPEPDTDINIICGECGGKFEVEAE